MKTIMNFVAGLFGRLPAKCRICGITIDRGAICEPCKIKWTIVIRDRLADHKSDRRNGDL